MIGRIKQVYAAITNICLKIACVFLFFALVLIFTQVVLRFAFKYSIQWAEEVARYSVVTAMCLGVPTTARLNKLPKVDILYDHFPPALQKVLDVIFAFATMGISGYLTYYGVQAALKRANITGITFKISMGIMYGLVPFCCGLLFLNAFIHLLEVFDWKNQKKEKE